MKTFTISEKFSAAFAFAERHVKRGFQAKVAIATGADPANISSMKRTGKGFSEELRREIVKAVVFLIPDFPAKTYEDFLEVGRWILDGHDPEEWVAPVRGEIQAKLPTIKATAEANNEQASNISPAPPSIKKIPIVSWVNAGDWSKAVDPFYPGYAEDWIDTAATSNVNAIVSLFSPPGR